MSNPNPFLLAADASPALLPLLNSNPTLATKQDEHGYSLLHALTSYNHLDLLRAITTTFSIDPNDLRDEDGETALFVAETVEAAQLLVEELGADITVKNEEGMTAEERIRTEGEFVVVADYLGEVRRKQTGSSVSGPSNGGLAPLPNGVSVNLGTMDEGELGGEVDEEFKRRIEALASREDFSGQAGQRELRELVEDAVRGVGDGGRDVRRRLE